MLKKLLIASLFVGGGVFFIKKILPQLTGSTKDLDVDLEDIDAVWLAQQRELEEMARKAGEAVRKQIGDKDPSNINSWIFAPNLDYDEMSINVKEQLAEQFGVDEFWNPNNLSSYKGLEGWSLGLPNVTVPKPN